MIIKSVIKYLLKLLVSVYLGAAVGYVIKSLVSTKIDYFLKALSPGILFNEIVSGNSVVVLFAALGLIIFVIFIIKKN